MISFKQFLSEERYAFEDVLAQIHSNCQPFLHKSSGQPLYRGIRTFNATVATFTAHPSKRPPKDSDRPFNMMINSMIQVGLGIENIRPKSLFATGNLNTSSMYGTVMYCFPAGDLKFVWSPKISDAYEDSGILFGKLRRKLVGGDASDEQTPLGAFLTARMLSDIFRDLSDVYRGRFEEWANKSVDSKNTTKDIIEDLLFTSRTIATRNGETESKLHDEINTDIYEDLLEALKETCEELYNDSVELESAIKSQNEIMFYESNGYYLIPTAMVGEAAKADGLQLSTGDNDYFSDLYEYLLNKL